MPGRVPLRICGVVPIYCHPQWRGGGLSLAATDLLTVQARRGNTVNVITPLFDGDHEFEPPAEHTFYGGRLNFMYNGAARRSRLKFGTTADGLAELLEPVLANTDVLHIHSFMSPCTDAAARMAHRAGVPYVIQDHGKLTPSVLSTRAPAKRLYLWMGGRNVLRRAACIVPSSEVVAQSIRESDPAIHCEACTNGLDDAQFQGPLPPRPMSEPYVLYLGWLDPRKNPDMLVRAFARIAADVAPWKLAFVGPDSYGMLSILTRTIAEHNLQERVMLPGMARGEAKLAWLRHAGMFVLPSAGEGLSLAMIEAAACGLPLLLSPGCNYPEAEHLGAGRTLPLEEAAWATTMREVILDDKVRTSMGANARKLFLRCHTLDAVGEQLEALMKRAAATRAQVRI